MEQLIQGLIEKYGFERNGESAEHLVTRWLDQYEAQWIRLAIIEALYQGRYKAISVEQILTLWERRGQAKFHFSHEFERLICRRLPKKLQAFAESVPAETSQPEQQHQETEDSPSTTVTNATPSKQEQDETPKKGKSWRINRFQPLFDRSHFYSKLKAVADS